MSALKFSFFAFALVVQAASSQDVRLVDAAGTVASVGLLQVRTDSGFGSVCGANPAAADVVCKAMGYAGGVVSSTPCSFYGGANVCGAAGSPVAMADLKCTGAEWSLEDCEWAVPDAACATHDQDTVVYCMTSRGVSKVPEGSVRLLAHDDAPSLDGMGRPEVFEAGAWTPVCSAGFTSGAASVLCKQMGFTGAKTLGSHACGNVDGKDYCGAMLSGISQLSCVGSEASVAGCHYEVGDDVFCANTENVVISCSGDGETQGRVMKEAAAQPAIALPVLAPAHKK